MTIGSVRPETGRGAGNWSVFEQHCRRGAVFLKNSPHDIENPAALNLGGGFRDSISLTGDERSCHNKYSANGFIFFNIKSI